MGYCPSVIHANQPVNDMAGSVSVTLDTLILIQSKCPNVRGHLITNVVNDCATGGVKFHTQLNNSECPGVTGASEHKLNDKAMILSDAHHLEPQEEQTSCGTESLS